MTVQYWSVMAATLIFPNNETAVLLVYQAKPVGHEVFSFVNAFFCFKKVEHNL